MIDFPSSPTIGQTLYVPGNGITYRWDGTLWLAGPNVGPSYGPGGDFMASNSAQINVGATEVKIIPDTVITGNSGNYYNPTTGRYTPPAGRYYISCTPGMFGSGAGATIAWAYLRKNGVQVARAGQVPGTAGWYGDPDVHGVFDCNGSDYFEAFIAGNLASAAILPNSVMFLAFPIAGAKGPTGDQGAPGLPGSINGWRQINRVVPTVGQANIDFTNIPADINDLMLHFDLTPQTNASSLYLRFFDGAGAVVTSARYFQGCMMTYHTAPNGSPSGIGGSTFSAFVLNYPSVAAWGVGNNPNFSIRGRANIQNIRPTTRTKGCDWQSSYFTDNATYYAFIAGSGFQDEVRATTGVRLTFSSPGFQAGGSATLWGSP